MTNSISTLSDNAYRDLLSHCWSQLNRLEVLLRFALLKHTLLTDAGLCVRDGERPRHAILTEHCTFADLCSGYNALSGSGARLGDHKRLYTFKSAMVQGRFTSVIPSIYGVPDSAPSVQRRKDSSRLDDAKRVLPPSSLSELCATITDGISRVKRQLASPAHDGFQVAKPSSSA
jgi:hypothetical protein